MTIAPHSRILDFGCGDGALVRWFRDSGYDAYGCDIELASPADHVRRIETPYALPFEDASFDVVVSNQVFEHVQDYRQVLGELRRVSRRRAVGLHLFPSRWRPIETHVRVPFASVLSHPMWLRVWARAGVRNEFQQDKGALEVAALNHRFLSQETNYLPRRKIVAMAEEHFSEVRFVEQSALRHAEKMGHQVPTWAASSALLGRACSEFVSRVLFVRL